VLGRVIVNAPPEVIAIILSPLTAVYALVLTTQGDARVLPV